MMGARIVRNGAKLALSRERKRLYRAIASNATMA